MISWTSAKTKMQRQTKNSNADTLAQLAEDWNTGYHMFNAKLARYYARKQQFADLKANQSIYQVPVDCIRVMGMTVVVSGVYQPPLVEVVDEQEWRQLKVTPITSAWPSRYFVMGNNLVELWPTPSQGVTNGIRFWYQPQDHDLSIDDTLSNSVTATINQGQTLVTANSGSPFTSDMAGLWFQQTGVADLTWYPIVAATTTTLTLQAPFVGVSASAASWRVAQCSILPQEYDDAPMHYALGNYWAAQGNLARSAFHLGTNEKPGMFYQMINDCLEQYSNSSTSNVITSDGAAINLWLAAPPASSA